ncbi:MAG TPA: adenylyl-sulfate kinase [Candidatus Caenarcaniphilales bacterium]
MLPYGLQDVALQVKARSPKRLHRNFKLVVHELIHLIVDVIYWTLSRNLGFSKHGYDEHICQLEFIAPLLASSNIIVLGSTISTAIVKFVEA